MSTEKPVRILFTTQVRDSVIPELKLFYTPVPRKSLMCTPISILQEEEKRLGGASCKCPDCSPARTKWVGYSMSLWRLCHDKHQNKVITVTGDDQTHHFHRLSFPFLHAYFPLAGSHFIFLLVDLSFPTLAGIQQEKAPSA